MASNLTGKGQTSNGNETLQNLVDKVAGISTETVLGEGTVSAIYENHHYTSTNASSARKYSNSGTLLRQINVAGNARGGLFQTDFGYLWNSKKVNVYDENGTLVASAVPITTGYYLLPTALIGRCA